jgi:hypothetical protein
MWAGKPSLEIMAKPETKLISRPMPCHFMAVREDSEESRAPKPAKMKIRPTMWRIW